MLAILIAALTHDVPEQHATLRRIDHVLHGGGKQAEKPQGNTLRQLIMFRRRDVSLRFHLTILDFQNSYDPTRHDER